MEKDIQSQLKLWIKERLKERGHGAQTSLASHLKLHPSAVNRMLHTYQNGKSRDITIDELIKISEFFNEPPPSFYKEADLNFVKICTSLEPADKEAVLDFLELLKKIKTR
ncbi:XRE family transcriptional regulator [Bartonella sp. AU18XJBT]|uniref:XRE family transcriptional regulator n=1 Tax=Bartonella sp. AU18XJBT TaxID=3019089 RepID=UPI0023622B2D|nr:XRE family transcriptional regulator [Bartonella sp. AU18XJBT]